MYHSGCSVSLFLEGGVFVLWEICYPFIFLSVVNLVTYFLEVICATVDL